MGGGTFEKIPRKDVTRIRRAETSTETRRDSSVVKVCEVALKEVRCELAITLLCRQSGFVGTKKEGSFRLLCDGEDGDIPHVPLTTRSGERGG